MIDVSELNAYGSVARPTGDNSTVGGAIDPSTKLEFADLDVNDYIQLVGESVSEDVVVLITGRMPNGLLYTETLTCAGRNIVLGTTVFERLMKIEKIGSAPLPIAVERKTPALIGAAAGGGVSTITLPSTASSSDSAYAGMLVRLTSGPGSGQVARILSYVGSTRTASVDARWTTPPTNLTGFRISAGSLLRSITSRVVRPFWNTICDVRGGAEKVYYDKIFLKNDNDLSPLVNALVLESSNPSGIISFAVDAALDGSMTSVNRRTAPTGLTFSRAPKEVPGLDLPPNSSIGVWLELRLPAGYPPIKTTYGLSLTGSTT